MTAVVVGVLALAAVLGIAMGGRHLYLRVDRPRGINCSLRVLHGSIPGLTRRFRAGYAGPEPGRLMWRRVAWPDPAISIPVGAVRLDRERRPRAGERLAIPASFTVVPVELGDDVVLELALPRTRRRRLVDLLSGGPGTGPGAARR